MDQEIINDYKQRASFAGDETAKYAKLAETYSLYRLGVFAFFILSVCLAIYTDTIFIIVLALIVVVICFSWLVKKQGHFEVLKNYWLDIKKVNENEYGNMQTFSNVYDNGSAFINDKHFYLSDLDIFGNNSLYQMINRAATPPGMVKLAKWLYGPADKETIRLRQEAIAEIAGKNDWKLDFQAHLLFCLKQQKEQIKNMLAYLKLPLQFEDSKWIKSYLIIAPWMFPVLFIISFFYLPAGYFLPILAMANYRIVSARGEIVKKTDLIAGRIGKTLDHFFSAFKSIEEEEWKSVYLNQLYAKLKNERGGGLSGNIKHLSALINKLNYRLNLLVGFVLNMIFLWDLRQVIAIEEWKKSNNQNFETAFDAIAEYEALLSLSSLHINYPDWCFPEITDGPAYTLAAKGLAHPLISRAKRIENDYELDSAFNIDIITGSNMAGKSTFLRTAGINTVLALCGAPVCAQYMKVSVMTILSYMRIKDSLNESTSTFKAELDRLQMLLKAVESDQKIFFLIDEMLRGTNSVDKYLGSKAVIERLISKKAVGMVATHDLQIAELEKKYPVYIRNFYFDIQVVNGEMLFDYKMKHGECKTFNASLLLKQIGIDVEAE